MQARGDRQDVLYIEAGNRDKRAQTNYALPLDEMNIGKDNGNPFTRYAGYGSSIGNAGAYTAGGLDCCTVFTLPYWLGRYYGIIEETDGRALHPRHSRRHRGDRLRTGGYRHRQRHASLPHDRRLLL